VLNQAGPVLAGRDLPEFLEADAVLLRFVALVEVETPDESFRKRPARPFRNECVLAAQLHAANEIFFWLAIATDAHIAGRNADNGAVLVVKHLGCGEARVDFDAKLCCLLA
jgi:hypothetical protein